jgi:hypothetical protein
MALKAAVVNLRLGLTDCIPLLLEVVEVPEVLSDEIAELLPPTVPVFVLPVLVGVELVMVGGVGSTGGLGGIILMLGVLKVLVGLTVWIPCVYPTTKLLL